MSGPFHLRQKLRIRRGDRGSSFSEFMAGKLAVPAALRQSRQRLLRAGKRDLK